MCGKSIVVWALMTIRSRVARARASWRGGFGLATDATSCSVLLLGHENTRVRRDTISCAGTQVGANDHQEQGGKS